MITTTLWAAASYLGICLLYVFWYAIAIWCVANVLLAAVPRLWSEARYWLSIAGMLAMLFIPTFGWFASVNNDSTSVADLDFESSQSLAHVSTPYGAPSSLLTSESPVVTSSIRMTGTNAVQPNPELAPPSYSLSSAILMIAPYLGSIWLTIVTSLFFRKTLGLIALRGIEKTADRPFESQEHIFNELLRDFNLTTKVKLLVSKQVDAPIVFGIRNPIVAIPHSLSQVLSTQEQERILAHEIAHVKRGDLWIYPLQTVSESLLFFHPCVWQLSRIIRMEREFACDERSARQTGHRQQLGNALLKLVECRSSMINPLRGDISATGGEMLQRIQRLCNVENSKNTSLQLLGCIATLLLVFVCTYPLVGETFAMGRIPTLLENRVTPEQEPTATQSTEKPFSSESAVVAAISDEKIGGVVLDENGTPVPNALVVLQSIYSTVGSPETKDTRRTDANGRFRFSGISFNNKFEQSNCLLWVYVPQLDVKCIYPFHSPDGPEKCRILLTKNHSFNVFIRSASDSPAEGAVFKPSVMLIPNGGYESDKNLRLGTLIPQEIVTKLQCTTRQGEGRVSGIDLRSVGAVKVSFPGIVDQSISLIHHIPHNDHYLSRFRELADDRQHFAMDFTNGKESIRLMLSPTGDVHGKITGIDLSRVSGLNVMVGSSRQYDTLQGSMSSFAETKVDEEGKFFVQGMVLGITGATLEWDPNDPLQIAKQPKELSQSTGTRFINLHFEPAIRVSGRAVASDTLEPV
ncbi:MAG: M56 family metallopeptidase, partial [Pirellula sp.]|nr:M56 family metallopeptidase [Pirellula sp.]